MQPESPRQMCQERGITLIEVLLFNRFRFNKLDVLSSIEQALVKAGFDYDSKRLPDLDEIIATVIKSEQFIEKLEDVCKAHNLTLLDETVWYGEHHNYRFKCNACGHQFSSSIYLREQAKHNCCRKCAQKLGQQKRQLSEAQKDKSYLLKGFSKKVLQLGAELTSKQWFGCGYDKVYEGCCVYCNHHVPLFSYNKVMKKTRLCTCEASKRPSSVTKPVI